MVVGLTLRCCQGARIFESAGIDDPIQTQLILGAVNVACTFYGLYIVEKYGRRWPMIIGGIWQGVWMLIFAAIGTALPPEQNSAAGIVMIVAACMFIASFASTWGPFCWVVIGETYVYLPDDIYGNNADTAAVPLSHNSLTTDDSFPLRTRARQASLATAANWLGNCEFALRRPG